MNTGSLNQYRILIVSDDPDVTLSFSKGLEQYGLLVEAFNHPRVALSKFKVAYYDLLLVNIRLPDLNGVELYEEIKKRDDNVKVCFITSFMPYYDVLKEVFPTLDLSCFIILPVEIEKLVKKIREKLEHGRNQ